MGKNIISAVSMAKGEFIWVIGNDDLLLPNTLKKLNKITVKRKPVKKKKDMIIIKILNNFKIIF